MLKITVKNFDMGDSDGRNETLAISDFLLRNPSYGILIKRTTVFPSVEALNDFLCSGKADAGMSGMFEWDPIKLTNDEYDKVKLEIENVLSIKYSNEFVDNGTMESWFSLAMKNKKNNK